MLTNLDAMDASPEIVDKDLERSILEFRGPGIDTTPRPMPPSIAQRVYLPFRQLMDFSLAVVLTLIATPIVLFAALVVRLTSRGPAFYTQTRTGKGGKPFTIFKIRTMMHNCESLTGPRWTLPGDPRITPIGWFLRRTHIDELPQLLNVLKGEMSLIGPRPERPEFVTELTEAIPGYAERHAVLPGITGLAQVQLAPDTDIASVRQKLRYDLHFIGHMSLWLDIRILIATALHALGVSLHRLRKLGIVPSVVQVERKHQEPVSSSEWHTAAA